MYSNCFSIILLSVIFCNYCYCYINSVASLLHSYTCSTGYTNSTKFRYSYRDKYRNISVRGTNRHSININNYFCIYCNSRSAMIVDEVLERVFSTGEPVTIIGFGSLMSPTSSKGTFPNLKKFRKIRIQGYRRVFRHPTNIFFERGIANLESMKIASLSTEKAEDYSFLGVAFELEGEAYDAFLKREEEYSFDIVPFIDVNTGKEGKGLMCIASTDDVYISRWGRENFNSRYVKHGLSSIWGYDKDSGILPCSVYLRHCYLSAQKLSVDALNSFLDDTYLADRVTTIRQYLEKNPEILETLPPDSLIGRYSG